MTLAQYLAEKKITQDHFADLIGVSQPAVSKWLNGQSPNRKAMVRISEMTHGAVPVSSWFPAQGEDAA